MPANNNFQHSVYARADPGERLAFREVTTGAQPDSVAWQDEMARLGQQMAGAGVRALLFLHGTHLGTDLFGMQRLDEVGGLKRGYSRGIAGLDALLALMREESNGLPKPPQGPTPPFSQDDKTTSWLDQQTGDACNFTQAYVERVTKAVNRNAARPIECRRWLWASEHHHLGRAQAACRLLDRLQALARELKLGQGDRLLVQAHGQAGLVMALLSNLLAPGESSGRDRLWQILANHAKQTQTGELSECLGRVDSLLKAGNVLNGAALDVVTFGMPVRYGWDPSGLGKLLHIVNHRPMRTDGKRWLAKMELPQITMEMPIAWGGDYVQQLALAVTDALPATPEANAATKAIWEIVEPYDGFERWLECTRKCVRCANDGRCLLVDYKDATGSTNPRDHIYGHAAYTRLANLLFNTIAIVDHLYPA
ncbi:MAG: hypothetical protein KGN30_08455 [Nitrospirota bacterium]|nr:hypothetical protein [Nitrospirota bacterium]